MSTRIEDEVRSVQRELGDALIHKDLDRVTALMTADVTMLGSKGPAVIGHDAVRTLYADLFDRFSLTVWNADCTVDVLGEAALVSGRQTTRLIQRRGGRGITVSVRVVAVYRREGGSWKLARALSVVAPAAATGGIPAHVHRSELLRRAQADPGRIIYPEVA